MHRLTSCSPPKGTSERCWRPLAALGARLLLQTALEIEVTEFLGRERYERHKDRAGSRNGYGPFSIEITARPVTLERPKLRGTTGAFASRLLGAGVTRTNAIEALVIAAWVRGMCTETSKPSLG